MMINKRFFFDYVRYQLFKGRLSQRQVEGMEQFLDYWEHDPDHLGLEDFRWLAYILGTVYHETDRKFQPIEEYGKGRGKRYGQPDPITGQIYYGRGYIQLTWKENYQTFSQILNVDLVNNPELALNSDISIKITFYGMIQGSFTGYKLSDFFIGTEKEEWENARKIVNPGDRKTYTSIAEYARSFYAAISLISC